VLRVSWLVSGGGATLCSNAVLQDMAVARSTEKRLSLHCNLSLCRCAAGYGGGAEHREEPEPVPGGPMGKLQSAVAAVGALAGQYLTGQHHARRASVAANT